jgi:hypothetical protein
MISRRPSIFFIATIAFLCFWIFYFRNEDSFNREAHAASPEIGLNKRLSVLSRTRPRIKNIVLAGQFNYDSHPTLVHYWVMRWREFFETVVVCGPFSRSTMSTLQEMKVNVYLGKEDRGYFSPIRNLVTVLRDYQNTPGIDGVMIIHDDMLVNMTRLLDHNFQFPKQDLLINHDPQSGDWFKISNAYKSKSSSWSLQPAWPDWSNIARRDPPAIFQSPPDYKNMTRNQFVERFIYWKWVGHCADGAGKAILDKRSNLYRNSDGSVTFPLGGDSDFAYVPMKFADIFNNAADWLVDSEVFLECALPMLTRIVMTHGGSVRQVPLCTSWVNRKNPIKMLQECNESHKRAMVYHPIKQKSLELLATWDAWFDFIVHGTGHPPQQ